MSHPDESTRCTHVTSSGRRCRMPRVNAHVALCGTHLEAEHRRLRSDPSIPVHDALNGVTDLNSATAVNHVLGNLAALVTDDRIDYRKAVVLAYLCQLSLQCINMAKQERWDDNAAPGTGPAPKDPRS